MSNDFLYQGKQTFIIKKMLCDDEVILKIEVDFSIIDHAMLTEINQFWSGNKDRLIDHNDNVLFAVLDMAANAVIRAWLNSYDMLDTNKSILYYDREGWPTDGIKLISLKGEYPVPTNYCAIEILQGDKTTLIFNSDE